MLEPLTIQSHKGPYSVEFDRRFLDDTSRIAGPRSHVIIDAKVASLYPKPLRPLLVGPSVIEIDAIEDNKTIESVIPVIERLVASQVRRGDTLVAVGGGIIQDITCFIASTLLRGVDWRFVPTTLLAQADSCIGSKSSINIQSAKNILGTFYPPSQIIIDPSFLNTLDPVDVRSGIGEIIKVHAIDGPASFDRLALEFPHLTTDRDVLLRFVGASLQIKKRFIEVDEFDAGVRNIFNYGHSFGHAIESATNYGVPHGIAVTMGMAIANDVAVQRDMLPASARERMRPVLRANYADFKDVTIGIDALLVALTKDKKNTATELGLVLPVGMDAKIERVRVPPDDVFRRQCENALANLAG